MNKTYNKEVYDFLRKRNWKAGLAINVARNQRGDLRVRWVPEDIPVGDIMDWPEKDMKKLYEQLESGKLDYLCAIVERQCTECGHWEIIDSLGTIFVTQNDPYIQEIEYELIAQNGIELLTHKGEKQC